MEDELWSRWRKGQAVSAQWARERERERERERSFIDNHKVTEGR